MRYTFLLYSDPAGFADMTEADEAESQAAYGAYIGALQEAGILLDTDYLAPVEQAATLSLAGGDLVVHDGPFAETRETLGGTFVVDVPDLDTAIEWAKQCPVAYYGKVEIRPSAMPQQG